MISGATRGIGHATAKLFWENGWQILNLARTELAEFSARNLLTDLALPRWEEDIAGKLGGALQGATQVCLVHNAGQALGGSVFDASVADLERSLQVNLLAPFRLTQLVKPYLHAGSSVLFLGSTLSEKAVANYSPYVISKHALIGLMRSTCQDLNGTGVHTACVCPGFVDTPLLRDRCDEATLQRISSWNTMGRLIQAEEIAQLLLFCAQNPAINGSVLHANLGQIER
ncbi:MAG TPA: SDR family oxidoreductase [Polyangiaceae bacterium]|nr:SDR family oxidoreductase [Polyangiaceae bacterium]